jgi:hypothetical protein
MKKEYDADRIIKTLERLHPQFYPKPGRQISDQEGKIVEVVDIASGFLTKKDLLILYGMCGVVLHQGNLKGVLSKKPRVPDFEEVNKWSAKIVTLLSHHQIQLINPRLQIWILMQAQDGRVWGHLMQEKSQ